MNEVALVKHSLEGDLEAFNQLVLKHQALVYQVAYHLLYDEDAASDAVQRSLVSAFRMLDSFQCHKQRPFQSSSFRNWLVSLVIDTCCNPLHRRQYCPIAHIGALQVRESHETLQPTLLCSPLCTRERAEVLPHLIAGIQSLPLEQRVALALSDVHGFSYPEIAEICKFAPETAKMCVRDARVRLRDYLVQAGCLPVMRDI